ncbi:hypothetical protein B0A54_05035 [Friedmanniomyces endolithicus]|uniref:Triosephosphate isomerase n=1 Tax=Friedmanniomyces endolithicus TaxID=329885 RepID=A0A4U0V7D0_9PEZI|nr:hypothetical protein B0A54_05035 [Friedmanniomyces endolithicus]
MSSQKSKAILPTSTQPRGGVAALTITSALLRNGATYTVSLRTATNDKRSNCIFAIAMPPLPTQREKRIVGTSLKMYFDLPSTLRYIDAVAQLSSAAKQANVDLFVIPDFVTLLPSAEKLKDTNIQLGAQDTYSEDKGAFTGEISPVTLKQAGASIVEIGHAERRRLFGETDADVAKKAAAVARNGMTPLVCIGEKSKSNIASQAVGIAVSECKPQIKAALSQLPDDADVILAYEPVWAIGASEPAGADHVVAVTQNLRALVAETGRKGRTRILYGGSAGPGTFQKLKDGVDGLFLGRFAHDVGNLEKVIEEMMDT